MRPPRLISINQGGCFKTTTSVNILTEPVALEKPPQLIDVNRGGDFKLPASVNH